MDDAGVDGFTVMLPVRTIVLASLVREGFGGNTHHQNLQP
jgi:hypothetical protein